MTAESRRSAAVPPRDRAAPTDHGAICSLGQLEQFFSGKPPVQATMMVDSKKRSVLSGQSACYIPCWSLVVAAPKCTAVQVFSELKCILHTTPILNYLIHQFLGRCCSTALTCDCLKAESFTLSPSMARLKMQSVSPRCTPLQPGYGGMQLTWRV